MTQGYDDWGKRDEQETKLPDPGSQWRLFYGPGNINNRLYHVRAVVDEEWVVVRWWRKNRNEWFYQIISIYSWQTSINLGHLTLDKRLDREWAAW